MIIVSFLPVDRFAPSPFRSWLTLFKLTGTVSITDFENTLKSSSSEQILGPIGSVVSFVGGGDKTGKGGQLVVRAGASNNLQGPLDEGSLLILGANNKHYPLGGERTSERNNNEERSETL